MSKLDQILRHHQTVPQALGAGTVDRDKLHRELLDLQIHLRRLSWITAVMIAVVFAFEIVVAVKYLESPVVLSTIAAAMGITVTGAIAAMQRLARQSAQSNLVV